GNLFTGFPWLNIGYAHIDGALAGWAIITGAYGVTWMAVFTAAALACFFQLHRRPANTENSAQNKPWQASSVLILAFMLNIIGLIIHRGHWLQPNGDPFYVRLKQSTVPQFIKFDPEPFEAGIRT